MNILITGITGFIGGHICRKLLEEKNDRIVAIIREKTKVERYEKFESKGVICKFGELNSQNFIEKIFSEIRFDIVFHIAALRGGRNFSKKDYYDTNVNATKYIAEQCLKHNCKMIFCSSVGVFGAIPNELPPNENTNRKPDNYYHFTKIEAENELQKLVKNGLNLIIIRPSITYGKGDYGFPYKLINLVDKGLMILPSQDIKINMIDVETLTSAFINAANENLKSGNAYNISDKIPVSLEKLTNFINIELKSENYPKWKKIPTFLFRVLEFIFSKIIKNELWLARIQLISRSWYYDVSQAEKDLKITSHNTIPNFKYVLEWYKKTGR